ncbi:MAG: response regulator transcription factor, partial [Flavobacteriales bacterium]
AKLIGDVSFQVPPRYHMPAEHTPAQHRKLTIAVVDDHTMVLDGLCGLLERAGNYRIVLASTNGEEFLKGLGALPAPDLAIVDLSMPGTDGFAVINWLQVHRPTTRITAYSGFISTAWVARAIASGAHSYVEKISSAEEMTYVLDQLMVHGHYYNEVTLASLADDAARAMSIVELRFSERTMRFLRFLCEYPDKTYDWIAAAMRMSVRSIDDRVRELRISSNCTVVRRSWLGHWRTTCSRTLWPSEAWDGGYATAERVPGAWIAEPAMGEVEGGRSPRADAPLLHHLPLVHGQIEAHDLALL